jgi:hypothetical protein
MALKRARMADVRPLEVWDHVIDGKTLFAWQSDASFPERVVKLVESLAAPNVYLAGGRADLAAIADAVRGSGRHAHVDAGGPFAGIAGAARLAGPDAMGLDIGQTSIKAWHGDKRVRHPRDWSALPLADEHPRYEDKLVAAVDAVLRELGARSPTAVVAVPAEVDDACVMQGSSYPYPVPNTRLLERIAELTQAADVLVCNDAELVAHSAATVTEARPTLVLTFGWGVGAALLR